VLGPGSIVWSRSRGYGFHSVYRIAPYNKAFLREMTKELKRRGRMPLYKLMVAILNEGMNGTKDISLREMFRKVLVKEIGGLLEKDKESSASFIDKRITISSRNKDFCDECGEELFNYWAKCVNKESIICLKCALNYPNGDYSCYRAVLDNVIEKLLNNYSNSLTEHCIPVILLNDARKV